MKAEIPSDNNYEITDIDELIYYIGTLELDQYYGHDEFSKIDARIFTQKKPGKPIIVKYDDVLDCKKTEVLLKPYFSKFTPRKYSPGTTSIGLSDECKRELDNIKKGKESYEMVIWKLIMEHYEVE